MDTSINLDITHIPTGTMSGTTMIGFGQINPGFDLTVICMPGCFQQSSMDGKLLFFVTGNSATVPIWIQDFPVFHGVHVYLQSLALSSGFNSMGMLSSNGVDLGLGNW